MFGKMSQLKMTHIVLNARTESPKLVEIQNMTVYTFKIKYSCRKIGMSFTSLANLAEPSDTEFS